MLLRLGLTTHEMAEIYGISEKSVKQKLYVFKERVGLGGSGMSLRAFVRQL